MFSSYEQLGNACKSGSPRIIVPLFVTPPPSRLIDALLAPAGGDCEDQQLNQDELSASVQGTLPWVVPAGKVAVSFGAGYRKESGSNVATGTTKWRATGIPLHPGRNTITVVAHGADGNLVSRLSLNFSVHQFSAR